MRIPHMHATHKHFLKRGGRAAVAGALLLALGAWCPGGIRAANADDQARAPQSPTEGVLITWNAPAHAKSGAAQSANDESGIELLAESDIANNLARSGLEATDAAVAGDRLLVTAQARKGHSDQEALRRARQLPGAQSVQYNYVYRIIEPVEADAPAQQDKPQDNATPLALPPVNDPFAHVLDADPSVANQYWLYRTGLADAWQQVQTERTVTVAVLDTGAALDHEDLGNIRRDLAYDVTCDLPLAQAPAQDATGHGTNVAGVLAATANNGKGLAGASYNASIVPVKVADNSGKATITSASLIKAYNYLFDLIDTGRLANLRVINMSLGGYGNTASDALFHNAIIKARDTYGILSVCAGGNGYVPQGESERAPRTDPLYPSDFEECISVTGLEPDGTNLYWSDYNQAKDISAAARAIWSTSRSGAYGWASGTSEAAPMVSGTIALMCTAAPNATPNQICDALYHTARPIHDPVHDRTQTSGSHGALDASHAVAKLIEDTQQPDAPAFSDVAPSDWFYDAVRFVAKAGVMHGYAGTDLFGPADLLWRQDAACMLYNYLGGGEISPSAPQVDIKQDYYTSAVNWAVFRDVMNGYKNADGTSTLFGVGDGLSREQLANIIANVARKPDDTVDTGKYDALPDHSDTSPWAVANMQWAVDRGVLNGVAQPDGTRRLLPAAPVDRAQAAAIMANCIQAGIL